MQITRKLTKVPLVKLSVKQTLYASKITCGCRRFACILREVFAAHIQVKLRFLTGKLHETLVNCVWSLFTWVALHKKIPAFAVIVSISENQIITCEKTKQRNDQTKKVKSHLIAKSHQLLFGNRWLK